MLLSTLPVLSYASMCRNLRIHEDDAVMSQQSPLKEVFNKFVQAETSVDDKELLEEAIEALKQDQSRDWVSHYNYIAVNVALNILTIGQIHHQLVLALFGLCP